MINPLLALPFQPTTDSLALPGTYSQNVFAMAQRVARHLLGVELSQLVLLLLKIKTKNSRIYWSKELEQWNLRHKAYLQEKTINEQTGRYWYTHKLLRRSYFTIKRALPNMFHYLSNPKISSTANGIAGFFSHLKNHLDLHRGLTLEHRINFIKCYVYCLTANEFS